MIDSNASAAALRAGYKKKAAARTGSENLYKPLIKARLLELGKDTARKLEVSREEVLKMILTMAKEGEQEGNRIKAMDMLGKVTGIYEVDNSQTSTTQAIQIYLPSKE